MYYSILKLSSKRSDFYFFLLSVFLSAAFFIAPKIASAEIIINEIMYDLAGADDKHEWVELYNNSSAAVDLTGWKFNDGDTTTNHGLNAPPKNSSRGSLILEANGYVLLADDATTLAADLPSYSGSIIDTILNLLNSEATLKLLNADGLEMSTVTYNKNLGGAGNGRTIEWDGLTLKEGLLDNGTPGQLNSVINSSSLGSVPLHSETPSPSATPSPDTSAVPSPTPSAAPLSETTPSDSPAPTILTTVSPAPTPNYQYSQKVFINEFSPWPENGNKEWVEIINQDNIPISLFGWRLDDGNTTTSPQNLPADKIIMPGEFLVISFNNNILNNDGDKVRLLWPDGQEIHSVAYAKATQGQTIAKFDTDWLWTNQPTPGLANKKSFTEKEEATYAATAPKSADKIVTVEDAVSVPTSAPPPAAPKNNTGPSVAITPSTAPKNNLPEGGGAPEPNLLAAVSEPAGKAKNNSYLALAGILLLAFLSAGGLIYFRRLSKPVDDSNLDD